MTTYRTNMISTKDKKLIIATNNDLFNTRANINQWDDSAKDLYQWTGAAPKFNIQTKDIDFGNPSGRKKIYKVYVTFKAGGYMSGVIAEYATNGSNTFTGNTFQSTTYYDNAKGFDSFNGSSANSTSDWITVALKPSSSINNVYSMQLRFKFADAGVGPNYRIIDHTTGRVSTVDSVEDGVLTGDDDTTIFAENPISTTSSYDIGFIPKEFEINDISIVYRDKPIR